jgi:hypothetical protein
MGGYISCGGRWRHVSRCRSGAGSPPGFPRCASDELLERIVFGRYRDSMVNSEVAVIESDRGGAPCRRALEVRHRPRDRGVASPPPHVRVIRDPDRRAPPLTVSVDDGVLLVFRTSAASGRRSLRSSPRAARLGAVAGQCTGRVEARPPYALASLIGCGMTAVLLSPFGWPLAFLLAPVSASDAAFGVGLAVFLAQSAERSDRGRKPRPLGLHDRTPSGERRSI